MNHVVCQQISSAEAGAWPVQAEQEVSVLLQLKGQVRGVARAGGTSLTGSIFLWELGSVYIGVPWTAIITGCC
jgi:hypothetical protein